MYQLAKQRVLSAMQSYVHCNFAVQNRQMCNKKRSRLSYNSFFRSSHPQARRGPYTVQCRCTSKNRRWSKFPEPSATVSHDHIVLLGHKNPRNQSVSTSTGNVAILLSVCTSSIQVDLGLHNIDRDFVLCVLLLCMTTVV